MNENIKKFVETNRKLLSGSAEKSEAVVSFREGMKRVYQLDILNDEKFPVSNMSFNYKEAAHQLAVKFKEADTVSLLPQLVRAGVQQLALRSYQTTITSFEEWATVRPSKLREELYAPSHGPAFPREVAEGAPYPVVDIKALDLKLANRVYGSVYEVSKFLVSDDQTGQIQEGAAMLGQYLRTLQEVLCYGKLGSFANSVYSQYTIPQSETQPFYEANYPYTTSAAPFRGGGFNRPLAFGALTALNIQSGIQALRSQKNLQGLIMPVVADQLLVGSANEFEAKRIAHSAYYPQQVGTSAGVGVGAFAENVMKGAFGITQTQFMFKNDGTCDGTSTAWYLTTSSAPGKFVMQVREGVAVEQEAVNSGTSFDRDIYRYKGYMRGNADYVDPRWFWRGSDGTA
jgi:hypothetical protein